MEGGEGREGGVNNYKKLKKFTVEKRNFGLCNYWHSTVIISRVNLIDLPSYLEVCVCVLWYT